MNSWELMFIQSKVNSGAYAGDRLARAKLGLAQGDLVSETSRSTAQQAAAYSQSNERATNRPWSRW